MTLLSSLLSYKKFATLGIRICKRCLSDELRFKIAQTKNIRNYLDNYEKSMLKNACPKLIVAFSHRRDILECLESLKGLKSEPGLEEMAIEENSVYEKALSEVEFNLILNLVPKIDDFDALIVEITAGIGGQEAMLFTKELSEMYKNYFDYKSWKYHITDLSTSEIGGVRQVSLMVEGQSIHKYLQHESGIHRVQRVPATEKSGRLHTSTVSVAIYPQPRDVDVVINDKDIVIETHRSSGAGGQHVNKTDSAVRLTHLPTGIVVDCQIDRSQIKNRQTALQKLRNIIYQKQIKTQNDCIRNSIKSQIGTKARSDKVRTYNYLQDRVTDHRLLKTYHNLPAYLKGGSMLDDTMTKLAEDYDSKNISLFLELIEKSS